MVCHLPGEPSGLGVHRRDGGGVLDAAGVESLADHHPGTRLELVLTRFPAEVIARQVVELRIADVVQHGDGIAHDVGVDGRAAQLDRVSEVGEQRRCLFDGTDHGRVGGRTGKRRRGGHHDALRGRLRGDRLSERHGRNRHRVGVADPGAGDDVQECGAVADGAGERVFVHQPFEAVSGAGGE